MRTRFRPDRQLTTRMVVTMFLLGLLYVLFVVALVYLLRSIVLVVLIAGGLLFVQ
jgi:heat shock protein HtpX